MLDLVLGILLIAVIIIGGIVGLALISSSWLKIDMKMSFKFVAIVMLIAVMVVILSHLFLSLFINLLEGAL